MITKQTLIIAIAASLFVGFFGGTIYTSFKLAADKPAGKSVQQQQGMVANNTEAENDHSIEISSKILKLEQYLKKKPKDAKAWAQLGHLFFDSNQFKNAIEVYEKSLALKPDDIMVITDLGVMYRRNKQPEKALKVFEKAILLDSSFETARFNKGVVLIHDLKDLQAGIQAWEALVDVNPVAVAPNGESVDALVQRMKKQAKASQ